MTTVLPKFLVLKSVYNNNYVRYVKEDVKTHGLLQCLGEEVISPYSKFEVEMAKIGNGLVHLRSCYNNRYWVKDQDTKYLIAGADEPEENKSKVSCTLFEPSYIDQQTIRLRHVQTGNYACLWRVDPPFGTCLYIAGPNADQDKCDVFTIIEWDSLVILPKHVAFKGEDGNYLGAFSRYTSLPTFITKDIGDSRVGHEIITTRDGSVRIKNDYFGKVWMLNNTETVFTPRNYIIVDMLDISGNNSDSLFWPVKVDNNIIALRNVSNNYFCERVTYPDYDCLAAGTFTISKNVRLEVEELVISRKVYNVDFHLMDARIYDQHVLTMATGTAINDTQEPNTIDVKLSYSETKTSTWDASLSLTLGITSTLQTGVPFIASGEIEISAEFNGEYSWGKTQSSTTELETVYKVSVPPMTIVKLSLLATKGTCDVPFSYTQHDTLTNGHQVTYNMDDGIYCGINSFNFKYETKQERL